MSEFVPTGEFDVRPPEPEPEYKRCPLLRNDCWGPLCALWQVDQPARTLTTTDPLGEEEQLPETGFCGLVAAPRRYVYNPAGPGQITPFGGKPWLFGGQK